MQRLPVVPETGEDGIRALLGIRLKQKTLSRPSIAVGDKSSPSRTKKSPPTSIFESSGPLQSRERHLRSHHDRHPDHRHPDGE